MPELLTLAELRNREERPKMTPVRKLLTVAEVAETLAVSEPTVYRMIYRGEIPSVRVRGARRIHVDAIDEYIAEHTEELGDDE